VPPIRPDEVRSRVAHAIPEAVFESFNDLIALHWDGRRATVKQNEVVDLITKRTSAGRQEIFDRHWLDVEEAYRSAGWKVEYDKPAYCETYEAFFVFSRPK
jgi:hypothetical protein